MSNGRSNYPGGFNNGVTIRGLDLLSNPAGEVFYVLDTTVSNTVTRMGGIGGSNGNNGTYQQPFKTFAGALDSGRVVADRGDTIYGLPGHVETISSAGLMDFSDAGVSIIGLGVGSLRATINFTTVVTASMSVSAANCTIQNVLFTGGIDALTNPVDIGAADFSMINCETRDVTGQATDFVVTDDNCDRLCIDGHVHKGSTSAGADTFLSIVGGDDQTIRVDKVDGNFAVSAIENVTTASDNIEISGGNGMGYIRNRNTVDKCVTMVSTATGWIGPNLRLKGPNPDSLDASVLSVGNCNVVHPVDVVRGDASISALFADVGPLLGG